MPEQAPKWRDQPDWKALLNKGDTIQYRCANPVDTKDSVQNTWTGPYTGKVVSIDQFTVEVHSDDLLYMVFFRDILKRMQDD